MTRRLPMVWVAGALALGVAAQTFLPLGAWIILTLVAWLASLVAGTRQAMRWASVALLIGLVGCGAILAMADTRTPAQHVTRHLESINRQGWFEATVASDPVWRVRAGQPVRQQTILELTTPLSGRVLLWHRQPSFPLRFGDRVRIHGTIRLPQSPASSEAFDEPRWLWDQGVAGVSEVSGRAVEWMGPATGWRRLVRGIYEAKQRALGQARQIMRPVPAALLGTLLAGERATLPRWIEDVFQATGTVHLLSVSGWHVTLIGGLMWAGARTLGNRRAAATVTALGLVGYCILTGAQVPIVRATIAGVLIMLGLALRWRPEPLNILACAAAGILIAWPRALFNIGCQLSFMSVASLLLFWPPLSARCRLVLEHEGRPRWVILPLRWGSEAILISVVTWLGTWPLVAYHLGRVTPMAWLANLVAVPLAAGFMVTGLVVLLGIGVHPWLVSPWVGATEMCGQMLLSSLAWCARLPGATIACEATPVWVLLAWYVALAVAGWKINRIQNVQNEHLNP